MLKSIPLLNIDMNKTNTIFLESLFQSCKQLGLVETQYDFSKLCGRNTTWFSASKCRNLPISSHAAITLSVRLKRYADEQAPRGHKLTIRKLSETLALYVEARALMDEEA